MRARVLTSNNDCDTGRPKGSADQVEIVLNDDNDAFLSLVGNSVSCQTDDM